MTETEHTIGTVTWIDLTVADAPGVRDFYKQVVGWETSPVDMGDYEDFEMKTEGGEKAVAGVCHARGGNEKLPAQWLVYVPVKDLEKSIATVERLGGKVVLRHSKNYCCIQDPAGAVMMIYQAL